MSLKTAWILSDGLPGHYNQSIGISNALQHSQTHDAITINISLKYKFLRPLMRFIANRCPGFLSQKAFSWFYKHDTLPQQPPWLIISAGGNTLFANIALARTYVTNNLFSGTLKGYSGRNLSKVFSVTPLKDSTNNVVLDLPPANIEKSLSPSQQIQQVCYTLLVGGNGAGYTYTSDDWQQLANAMLSIAQRDNIRWNITTSRRTGEAAEIQLKNLLPDEIIKEAIWFFCDPQKVVKRFINEAHVIFCTEDSLTMVSEAIYAHKPVVTLQPKVMKPVENDSMALDKYQQKQFIIRTPIIQLAQLTFEHTAFCTSYPDIESQIANAVFNKSVPNSKTILWWGRHGNYGPDYPRNRTIIKCLQELGHKVIEFQPHFSKLARLEAKFQNFGAIDMVWVPCFRHRDLPAAARWAKQQLIPLIFDPLISAYDKRVNEKKKYPTDSSRAKRLLKWEQNLLSLSDTIIADTSCHKQYFTDQLNCSNKKIEVIPVSAEEELFFPAETPGNKVPEILFFGTFIGLQGPEFIAESIKHYEGPSIKLTFLGKGPERKKCELICQKNINPKVTVCFEDWIAFKELPTRIRHADICLGIFGTGEKSSRVIPNKVYQALACAKPVITMKGSAYPEQLKNHPGIIFVPAGNPHEIAKAINTTLKRDPSALSQDAEKIYSKHFSNASISLILTNLISKKLVNGNES